MTSVLIICLENDSEHCKNNMHYHCESTFQFDCTCICHEHFTNDWGRTKPMTEKYFFEMVRLNRLTWI